MKSILFAMDIASGFWYNGSSIQRNVFFGVNMDDFMFSNFRHFDTDAPLAADGTIDRRFSPFADGADDRSIVPSFAMSADRRLCTRTPKEYLATEEPPSPAAMSAENPFPFALVPLGLTASILDVCAVFGRSRLDMVQGPINQEAIPWNSERTIH